MKASSRIASRSVLTLACALLPLVAAAQPHRRALLIGINDYTASQLGRRPPVAERDWPNLRGATGDALAMREMLTLLYGFDAADVVALTDQAATRDAIVHAVEQLAATSSKGDVVFFYFAGHGSQVRNSLSDEPDKLDEAIVPADAPVGATDIRDKELRVLFNHILDRGARLTVMLDNCHSGSGARGLGTGARPRGVRADDRDVADPLNAPPPESRGALVLSAAQDYDIAWETRDSEGRFHGVFSWAWLRAMRDSAAGEPVEETFLRAAARMRAETPFQDPVMAGNADARMAPFLGNRTVNRAAAGIAVEKARPDGTVILGGGWANGLAVGSELRERKSGARVTVTALLSLGRSEGRVLSGGAVGAGELLDVLTWAPAAATPLRVYAPAARATLKEIAAVARSLAAEAKQHGVTWISDPTDVTPTHLLRRTPAGWEMLSEAGEVESLAGDAAAVAGVAKLRIGSTLFVQFAAPEALLREVATDGVARADAPDGADYILTGRYSSRHLSYAWVRPLVKRSDRRKCGLPSRTAWIGEQRHDNRLRATAPALRAALLRLRTIHAWNVLESPPHDAFPYQLALRRARDGELAREHAVIGGESYQVVLRVKSLPLAASVEPRYVYAFVIDSNGASTLLFPPADSGSVENRLPAGAPSPEIDLGDRATFEGAAPYGVDTYVLLTTDEPLRSPAILESEGVRAPQLAQGGHWSIDRVTYECLPSHAAKASR